MFLDPSKNNWSTDIEICQGTIYVTCFYIRNISASDLGMNQQRDVFSKFNLTKVVCTLDFKTIPHGISLFLSFQVLEKR